ncbi:hypothetical protein K502DRAFT_323276 [Neoconidiobolus thromboides FSU 785]|nr:hypothetical protein K502DRAFT_323276 [Neoconidiobolus thromboides FSU 785]
MEEQIHNQLNIIKGIEQEASYLSQSFETMKKELSLQLKEYTQLSLSTVELYNEACFELKQKMEASIIEMKQLISKVEVIEKEMGVIDKLLDQSKKINKNLDTLEAILKY